MEAPLGGGAAVCNLLVEEWSRTRPFEFRLLEPSLMGPVTAHEIAGYSEREYARFSERFERASTQEILRHDPAQTVVLSNDVSEGPDFRLLAERGYRVVTIYHVDVVAYISAMYLGGWISPETLVRWHKRLGRAPGLLRLIFDKQRASMLYSHRVVVPSRAMKELLLRCYPEAPDERVMVLPWGAPPAADACEDLRLEYGVPQQACVLLTLSRLSPEKGQDLLLEALEGWPEHRPLWVFICGAAAYMHGRRFETRLRELARRLRTVRVEFPGHVTGLRKASFFRMADLYVFPSRHESYGLTLLEAMQAGLAAVCLDHAGARETMRPEFGELVTGDPVRGLRAAIERLLGDPQRRRAAGEAAGRYAVEHPFSASARRLAEILRQ